jgi:hypothetical protein
MDNVLRVFVSATFKDLEPLREAVRTQSGALGDSLLNLEYSTGSDVSQIEATPLALSETDAFVLVVGSSYGLADPDSGLSWAEIEYNLAVAQKTDSSLFFGGFGATTLHGS